MVARPRIALSLLAAAGTTLALALAGCGIHDPYNDRPPAARTATSEHPGMAPSSPDDPSVPPQVDPDDLPATPRAAIERYADLVGTWDWRTAEARYQAAVPLTADSARADTILTGQQFAIDPRYRTEQVRQHTTLDAAVPRGPGQDGGDDYIVVLTRELWTKGHDPVSDSLVIRATVHRFGDAWAIVRWDEQPA